MSRRTDGMSVRRVFCEPDGFPVASRYEVTTATAQFVLSKEFYAQGPSLFTWVLVSADGGIVEFGSKRAALQSLGG